MNQTYSMLEEERQAVATLLLTYEEGEYYAYLLGSH